MAKWLCECGRKCTVGALSGVWRPQAEAKRAVLWTNNWYRKKEIISRFGLASTAPYSLLPGLQSKGKDVWGGVSPWRNAQWRKKHWWMLLRDGPWTHTAQKDLPTISCQSCLAHLWHLLCVCAQLKVIVWQSSRPSAVCVHECVCMCMRCQAEHVVGADSVTESAW